MNRLKTILRSPWTYAVLNGLLAYGASGFWMKVLLPMAGRDLPAIVAVILGFWGVMYLCIFRVPALHYRWRHGHWPPTAREIKAARRELQRSLENLHFLIRVQELLEQIEKQQGEQEPWCRDPDWWRRN